MENQPAKCPAPLNVGSLPQRAWRYAKALFKDNDFWVRMGAFGSGFNVTAEGGVGAYFLLRTPFFLAVPGIGVCLGLMAAGCYGIYAGATGTWDRLYTLYTQIIRQEDSPLPAKNFLQKLSRNIYRALNGTVNVVRKSANAIDAGVRSAFHRFKAHPLVRKIAAKPLMRKFLNSKVGRLRHGLPQKYRNVFMSALTLKGAMVTTTASAAIIITHLMGLQVLSLGAIFTVPVIAATWFGSLAAIDIFRTGAVLRRTIRTWKDSVKDKLSAAVPAMTATMVPSLETSPAVPTAGSLTSSFTKAETPKTEEKKSTPSPPTPTTSKPVVGPH